MKCPRTDPNSNFNSIMIQAAQLRPHMQPATLIADTGSLR